MEVKDFYTYIEEAKMKTIRRKLTVEVDLNSTRHSVERQSRHLKDGGAMITQEEITSLMSKSIKEITELLIFNTLDIGDEIVITDKKTDLNVVVIIGGKDPKLTLIAKTVMRKKNFMPYTNQMHLKF